MQPATIVVIVILVLMIFSLSREKLLLPFIIAACLVPMQQRVIIAGLDFPVLRICVLAGFVRLNINGEIVRIGWNKFDKLFLSWSIVGSIVFSIQYLNFSAVVNRCGFLFDGIGMYWFYRQCIRNWDDFVSSIKYFAIMAIVSAPLIIMERKQGGNSIYKLFGHTAASFHRGRFRCAGPFPHYIMMGLYWATLLPLFYGLMKINKSRVLCFVGIICAMICAVLSGSSTPLMTVAGVVIFWCMYKYRYYGIRIFYIIIAVLFTLHLLMNKPVWHLMARAGVFGGSTGYHRYYLFDQFVNRVTEWFILGVKTTAHWGYCLQDVTNQFVLEAVRGGFVTLVIFILLIFQSISIPWKSSLSSKNYRVQMLAWSLSISMIGHQISFWGASYFGQIIMLLYFNFAMVALIEDENIKLNRHLRVN